jgi:hypothetical protein
MKTSELLHYAFRARDPEKLAAFYADLFEADYFLHPVMNGLGIVLLKLHRPHALFHGLLEFWPWDVVWDSEACVFRKVPARPSPTSYGHLAVKIPKNADEVIAELKQRGIRHRMEPRAPGFLIPTIDDPEGNMIELFPNVDHVELPPEAVCPRDRAAGALAMLKRRFAERAAGHPEEQGYPLTFMDG